MRTTIYLPYALLAQPKKLAAESHKTVTTLIEGPLKERLVRRNRSPKYKAVKLTTYGAGGLQPGGDLDDTSALLDLMERYLDPHRL